MRITADKKRTTATPMTVRITGNNFIRNLSSFKKATPFPAKLAYQRARSNRKLVFTLEWFTKLVLKGSATMKNAATIVRIMDAKLKNEVVRVSAPIIITKKRIRKKEAENHR